jgi:hypothetical protein
LVLGNAVRRVHQIDRLGLLSPKRCGNYSLKGVREATP